MNTNEHRQPGPGASVSSQATGSPALDDARVIEAVEQYLEAVEAGEKPNRQAFLARHADIAEALAQCLDGVDALHVAGSSLRRSRGGAGAAGTSVEWPPGTPLGDFRIIQEIGRGGMGVVYEAEQLSLGRRIALKVLPFALTLDPRQLQRFKNEARAAAHLHHPHIVPVHAVGCERGVHFYAMQYIEGQSLAEVIHDLRRAAGSAEPSATPGEPVTRQRSAPGEPTGGPVTRAEAAAADTVVEPLGALVTAYSTDRTLFYQTVARLGVQAAEALQHAHECGVVHRDIKPGNLLVDGHGTLWVTDFGLAQFHADAGLTQTGDLLGTLRYMSPEQAAGQRVPLDHRTDVYSLGATLYELLTLRPLFDGTDRQTLLHQILHDEPRPPRAVKKSVPLELETVVLKALARTPAERYATAQDFADDLSRFLEHRPILARPATPAQRARKWARRHPSVMVAGVVLCVLTTAGSLVSTGMIHHAQENTRTAYEGERRRAREAEERFLLARESVDEMVKVCQEEIAENPFFQGVRRRLLEDALVYYQKLIEQRRDDPNAQAELAATRARVQQILADLAVLQGAGHLQLLSDRDVLDDLRLTGDQRDRVAELAHRMGERRMESFREFQRLTPEERRQRFLDLARANDADVAAILRPEQRRRLREIFLQVEGPMAFQERDVTAALQLTPEQKERLRSIEAEAFGGPFGEPPRGRGPGRPPERGPPGSPFDRGPAGLGEMDEPGRHSHRRGPGKLPEGDEHGSSSMVAKMLAVLTEEQARRWSELTGESFKGRSSICHSPPPDGRGHRGAAGEGEPNPAARDQGGP